MFQHKPTVNVDSDDDDDDKDDDGEGSPRSPTAAQERPCVCCQKVMTTNRCTGCGFCPICSLECQKFYGLVHNGTAACLYHIATDKLHQVSPLDEECLGDLLGGPVATMGGTFVQQDASQAIQALVQFVVDQLDINETNAPLTMQTHIAASLVPIAANVWSRALLRIGHLPTRVGGASEEAVTAEEHRASTRLLDSVGKLAVAQSHSPGTNSPADMDTGHAFLLARVVRIPKKLNASFEYGLQFDLVMATKIRDMRGDTLRCKRYGGGFKTAVAIYKLKGSLHPESGWPIFGFPNATAKQHHVLLGKELCATMPTLLPHAQVRAALNIQQGVPV